jgi:hypothetical protein
MRVALIVLAFVVLTPTAWADGQIVKSLTPAEKLAHARQLFKEKQWQNASFVLNELLYPTPQVSRREDVIEVHMLLGTCHSKLNDRNKATREYELALDLDLERGMPEFYPEEAIRLFEETKARLKEKRAAEATRRELEEREKRIKDYVDSIGVYESRSWSQNLVPFGFPQSQNGHRTKAWIVGSGQTAALAVSLGSFLYLAGKYGLQAKVPLDDGPRVRRIQQLEIGSGIVFFAFYAYSVIDGFVHYQPRRRIEGYDAIKDLLKENPPPPKAKPKKTSLRERLRFGPMLTPNSVGIGVGWEND